MFLFNLCSFLSPSPSFFWGGVQACTLCAYHSHYSLQLLTCELWLQDATANDVPDDSFDVKGYPTVYFRSASGKILRYDGSRTKEDIIEFIQKNRDQASEEAVQQSSVKEELWLR